jgi:hypothetical protein
MNRVVMACSAASRADTLMRFRFKIYLGRDHYKSED